MSDLFGGNEMLALSWKQPFASAMLVGKVETRTWFTNYRGLVLICASQQPYNDETVRRICGLKGETKSFDLLYDMSVAIKNHIHKGAPVAFDSVNTNGMAIAVGRLINCCPMTKEDEDKAFVKYQPGLWCHFYDDVKPIKPFPWKGAQGWKKVPQEIIDSIEYL